MLEDREVPALLNWVGTFAGGFSNPANWYGSSGVAPTTGDDLNFGTVPQGRTISCVIPSALTFKGIHLISGYTGTVTVQDDTSVGTLN